MECTEKSVPAISVIMPVYNVARYIREAVDSVLSQTFADFELILVDDGSTDGCGDICDEYVGKDGRVGVIHIPNGGVSAARNAALTVCRGKYVSFADSDDRMEPEMLEQLYRSVCDNGTQLAVCDFSFEWTTFKRRRNRLPEQDMLNHDELMVKLFEDDEIDSYLWNKLFDRDVITELFPVGREYEDTSVMHVWLDNVEKASVVREALYNYRMRAGSIVHDNGEKARKDRLRSDVVRAEYYLEHHATLMAPGRVEAKVISSAVGAAKAVARNNDSATAFKTIRDISEMVAIYEPAAYGGIFLNEKTKKRFRLMKDAPMKFIRRMRLQQIFQFSRMKKERNCFK